VRRLGSSTAELVRRSVKAYEPDVDYREIEALLRQFSLSHEATLAALGRVERELAQTRACFAGKSRKRR